MKQRGIVALVVWLPCWFPPAAIGQEQQAAPTAAMRIKDRLGAIPAIDTHDHLYPFDRMPGRIETEHGSGMTLYGLWRTSYFPQIHAPTPRRPIEPFEEWWNRARHDFDDARATGFYRYQLPAFRDLYGVDFDRITDAQARELDARIFENYRDAKWLTHVVTERANIELMLNDPHWGRFEFETHYPFEVLVFNVTTLLDGFHPSEFRKPTDDPYHFARGRGLKVESLGDYLTLVDRLFQEAKAKGAVCLKTTKAYNRTLAFDDVPRERAERVFGRPRAELSAQEVKDFQDFMMWRLVELSARYDLPFQIHTGHGRLQGSNPLLLADLIEANPKTKFILFHGGYPWVGETGAIVLRHGAHVWVDSVWLPTISPTMARRALHEWLEVMPSDRIMWGADCNHAEGIYGATAVMRRVLAEVLAEKVDRGELLEAHALRIGRQILRENALALFPRLKERLWKEKEAAGPDATAGGLTLAWAENMLTVRGRDLPGGELKVLYLEAFCRPGSTDRDWKETVIPHATRLVEASPDGRRIRLRSTLEDGVVVDHEIRAGRDEVDFHLVATNPRDRRSQAHWAQPCVQVDAFTGVKLERASEEYLPRCFLFVDGKLTRMPTQPWAKTSRYTPGQVWCPAHVDRADVNPRPLSPLVPSSGLIGCFSADGSRVLATAWEPYQELFQGVFVCLHSDFRVGGLDPGETKRIRGKLYITGPDIAALVERYEADFPEHRARAR